MTKTVTIDELQVTDSSGAELIRVRCIPVKPMMWAIRLTDRRRGHTEDVYHCLSSKHARQLRKAAADGWLAAKNGWPIDGAKKAYKRADFQTVWAAAHNVYTQGRK